MTTTLNAPPDQINGGLTLGDGTTLNVGEGGTVSGIAVDPGAVVNVNGGAASDITANGTFNNTGQFVGGTINVNGGIVSGSNVNGTLNLKDGSITSTTVNPLGTLNLSGGTAVNTLIIGAIDNVATGTINFSGGIIDGISFDLSPIKTSYELQLNDFNSLQGPLGFDAPGRSSGPEHHYEVSLDFKHDDPSASVTLTRQTQTITIDYGQNQSVTYHYTTNQFTVVEAVTLLAENHQIELIVDVNVGSGPAAVFSAQSAGTIVYTAKFGSAPSATELTILNQFTQAQFDFGQKIGVMDPSIYAFQALGVALASGPHFQDTFGPTNAMYPVSTVGDVHFVDDAYASVFGNTGSAAQIQVFVDQLNSFEALYSAAGAFGNASNIDLLARGAIYGQMLGIEHESAPVSSEPGGTIETLINFNHANGAFPVGGLITDAAGDLFGTTQHGGANNDGTVFEIVKTASGYASTPTVLINFNHANGAVPEGGLITDAAGDLFGTTQHGGANDDGTVFGILKTASGYASTPTVLANFDTTHGAQPRAGLTIDAAGDLFGTTSTGGANNVGTVFEIANTAFGYASTPTVLFNFDTTHGATPLADLITDAAGDLFGTTSAGGANGVGTVFEIVKTASGYASTPTVLANFDTTHGAQPQAGLTIDAAGDLFGTTFGGGANNRGTVFGILKTASGYASTPTVLANFDDAHGAFPVGGLITDAAGDLFGTTSDFGANGVGTVFEIVKTAFGYVSTPAVLANFDTTHGAVPEGGLITDAAGDLFGTTFGGGANGFGTVFEITGIVP